MVLVADVGVAVVVVAMLVHTTLLFENWNSDTTCVFFITPVSPLPSPNGEQHGERTSTDRPFRWCAGRLAEVPDH